MVERALEARGRGRIVVRPRLPLNAGLASPALLPALGRAARALGAPAHRVPLALARAAVAQRSYERRLIAIGARTLAFARRHEIPVVAVCGALHVLHDPTINAGIPGALRQSGVLALPMDCYPLQGRSPALPRAVWSEASRALGVALASRSAGGIYPLLLTSFGCGPGSFLEQIFSHLMAGYPHTTLESDGHGGTAGYVTRIQAFLHSVRTHGAGAGDGAAPARLEPMRRLARPRLDELSDARIVVFSIGDRLSELTAAYLRSTGVDAVAAGPNDAESVRLGRRDCSGKECLPYQLIWASYRRHLQRQPPDRRTVLMQVSGAGMCRNCMFSVKDQLSLRRLGLGDQVELRHLRPEPGHQLDFVGRYFAAIIAWDILQQLRAYLLPLAPDPARLQREHERWIEALIELTGRPQGAWLARLSNGARFLLELSALLERAAAAIKALARGSNGARVGGRGPTVLLSGDIYLRLDAFGSDQLLRRLHERGLRVLLEPANLLVEYLAAERSPEIFGLPTDAVRGLAMRQALAAIRRTLYARARRHHPWLPEPDVSGMQRHARRELDRYPIGEAPACLGSVLHTWRQGACDGVVIVSPWACGHALIAESLLRHHRELPALFLYCDGSPIDEGRLDAFAFRLHRSRGGLQPHESFDEVTATPRPRLSGPRPRTCSDC